MKTKNCVIQGIFLVLTIFCFVSCDSLLNSFTTSPLKPMAEDLSELAAQAPASQVADNLKDQTPDQKAETLAGLGEKLESNPEEVEKLNDEQKTQILKAQTDAAISGDLIASLLPAVSVGGDSSGNAGTDVFDQLKDNPDDLISKVIDGISSVDTRATVAVLNKIIDTDDDGNFIISDDSEVNALDIATAAVSVVASTAKTTGLFEWIPPLEKAPEQKDGESDEAFEERNEAYQAKQEAYAEKIESIGLDEDTINNQVMPTVGALMNMIGFGSDNGPDGGNAEPDLEAPTTPEEAIENLANIFNLETEESDITALATSLKALSAAFGKLGGMF